MPSEHANVEATTLTTELGQDTGGCIEREVVTTVGMVRLVRFEWRTPVDKTIQLSGIALIDMCLTPRPSPRARFLAREAADTWSGLGKIVFLPPHIPIQMVARAGVQRALQCVLEPSRYEDLEWSGRLLRRGLDLDNLRVRDLCARLVTEMQSPDPASGEAIEALLKLLAIDVARYFLDLEQGGRQTGGLPRWRLARIRERVAQDRPAPDLEELAGLCGLSKRQLMRAFQQSEGESLGTYLGRIRVERARRALADGDRPLSVVARDLGFSSASCFSAAFRRATGVSPREYRAAAGHHPPTAGS